MFRLKSTFKFINKKKNKRNKLLTNKENGNKIKLFNKVEI